MNPTENWFKSATIKNISNHKTDSKIENFVGVKSLLESLFRIVKLSQSEKSAQMKKMVESKNLVKWKNLIEYKNLVENFI